MERKITITTTVIEENILNVVYLLKIMYKKSSIFNEHEEEIVFRNIDDAKRYMENELFRVGRRVMNDTRVIDGQISYSTGEHGCDGYMFIRGKIGGKIEICEIKGEIHFKRVE